MGDHPNLNRLAVGLVIACAAACARNVVRPMSENHASWLPRPTRVLIYDPVVRNAKSGDAERTAKEAAGVFAVELVEEVAKLGLRAERAGRHTPVPDNALLVRSELVDVHEGSQVERVVIGFGAGASRIDARVQIYYSRRGSRTKLLEFATHSDSGKMPGAAATLGAGAVVSGTVTATAVVVSSAVGGVKVYQSAVDRMVAESAEQAAHYLSEYFGKHRWIARRDVKKAGR